MYKIIYSLIITLFFFHCAGEKKTATREAVEIADQYSKIINMDDAFNDIREMRLSDIADSVSFLPLETTQDGLVSNPNIFKFTPSFIYYYGVVFDWTGKFRGRIVKRGQGTYEDFGAGYLLFHDNHFYSKGNKLIEYDNTGSPTGKVRNLYVDVNDDLDRRAGVEFFNAGKNLAVYSYPNRIFFINTDFETICSRLVAGSDTLMPNGDHTGKNFVTYYQDNILFYNFMNDTIFYVIEDGLEPQWIVNFTEEHRLSTETLLTNYNIFRDEEIKILSSGMRNFENTKRVLLFDKKHIVNGAFETGNFILFPMQELTPLAPARGKEEKAPYILIFDKSTHQTFRVKGDGFVDDLSGLAGMTGKNYFFPTKGIVNEKMIHAVWPFEIFEFIKACKDAGRAVNPRLLEFSKTIQEDDNPVLILVHLKRK